MKIDMLNKDFISLVMGTYPYYTIMDDPIIKDNGSYTGGFHDKWTWDKTRLNTLSDDVLLEIYMKCKLSWE